jgi:methylmalonyl-CoA mutase, N-terminal domain
MLRFHTQTGGSTLTAQQPLNNVVRVAVQALAAVMGGTQSAAHQRLRRGAVAAHGGGGTDRAAHPADHRPREPVSPTRPIRWPGRTSSSRSPTRSSGKAWEYIERIDAMGGAVAAIEAGFQMDEIEQAAYEYTKSIDDDERVIVGVNKFTIDDEPEPDGLPDRPGPRARAARAAGDVPGRPRRGAVAARLADVAAAARGSQNLLYPMKEALRANATLGEVSDALREVFGVYHP